MSTKNQIKNEIISVGLLLHSEHTRRQIKMEFGNFSLPHSRSESLKDIHFAQAKSY